MNTAVYLKRTRPEELVAAVRTVAAGDSLLSPSVTSRVIARMAQRPAVGAEGGAERLTARELEVLRMLAEQALVALRDSGDAPARVALARFFAENIAVQAQGLERTVTEGGESVVHAAAALGD